MTGEEEIRELTSQIEAMPWVERFWTSVDRGDEFMTLRWRAIVRGEERGEDLTGRTPSMPYLMRRAANLLRATRGCLNIERKG